MNSFVDTWTTCHRIARKNYKKKTGSDIGYSFTPLILLSRFSSAEMRKSLIKKYQHLNTMADDSLLIQKVPH